jgi:serine/threonine protein kinase
MAAEDSTATAVGSLLNGTYRLERVIAEGGMGVVYEAAHVRLPRRFAVKVLGKPEDSRVTSTALQRFRREAEIASTLAHPHIVEVFDYQISDTGAPYLVMELLEGEDLADRLKRTGRMPIVMALRIVEEVAQALDVAHGHGVVHRDLKPANIFLSRRAGREDFVKVLDFGVSKIIDAATLTHEKAMVGTPLYMSPEQAVGTQELSPASDVFSLGSIAYELLTGRRAFAASSIPSILYQIVHGPTPSLSGRAPGIGPAVDEVFQRVLHKKRDERFQRAGDFASALQRVIDRQSGQMPILKLPASPALDGNWQQLPEPEAPMDLALAPEGPSGLFKQTDVDPSTKAEEAMEAAALEAPPPSLVREHPSRVNPLHLAELEQEQRPASLQSIDVIVKRGRSWLWLLLPLPLLAAGALVWQYRTDSPKKALVAPEPAAAELARPVPKVITIPVAAPQKVEMVEPAHKATVQFTFHVVPKNAEIRVDDRRVKAQKIALPWQDKTTRKVAVSAPGYVPLMLTAESTENRVFELRMEKVAPQHRERSRPVPSHDAAPVQDL